MTAAARRSRARLDWTGLTQGDTRQTDHRLDSAKCIEYRCSLGPSHDKPVEALESQSEAEEILEDDHARKPLDCKVT